MRSKKAITIAMALACLAVIAYGIAGAMAADGGTEVSFSLPPGLNVWNSPGLQPIKMDIGMPDTNYTDAGTGNINSSEDLLAHNISFGAPGMSANITSQAESANNTTSAQGSSAGNTTAAQEDSNTPTHQPMVNPKSTKVEIQKMSDLERMLRNAFVGSTMQMAYEGSVQSPTWIDPYQNGRGVFNQINFNTALSLAHNETLPGTHLTPVFWNL
jgi:hypothetical protein